MSTDIKKSPEKGKPILLKLLIMLLCIILTRFISQHLFGLCLVSGSSMYPTMKSGDICFVNKINPEYERFSTVVIQSKLGLIVKRIIALPGETVQIIDGDIYINNQKINDVISDKTKYAGLAQIPIELGADEYFVMGDNREDSLDSRYDDIGIIKREDLVGSVAWPSLKTTGEAEPGKDLS